MSEKQIRKGVVWFRNDLRVQDNTVLQNAVKDCEQVIAVYCFDPRHYEESVFGFKKTEQYRTQFLIETVKDLKHQLDTYNIDLLVYHDTPEQVLPKLCKTHAITNVYLQKEWTQEEVEVEDRAKVVLPNVEFHSYYNQFLYHPNTLNFDIAKTPQVFTQFRKSVEKYVNIEACVGISKLPDINRIENTTQIPTLQDLGFANFKAHLNSAFPFKGGETSALARLEHYFFETKKLGFYKKTRNGLVGVDYSSKFSSWLANGSISARTIYWKVKQFEDEHYKNQSTYWLIFELIWRDYFKYISLKHGNSIFKLQGILNTDYEWRNNKNTIENWINGTTHSDFVNANMLELKHTGWMSNRGRQNVASYFAKTLKLDWRIGAAYFESLLIDYDVHSNYGNWMYVSGVRNDPRDRTFNVDLQAERYDANARFRKLWLQQTLF